jgi:hypothetical protein
MIEDLNQFYLGIDERDNLDFNGTIHTDDFSKGIYIVSASLNNLPETFKVLGCVNNNGNDDKFHNFKEGDLIQIGLAGMLPTKIDYRKPIVIGDNIYKTYSSPYHCYVYSRDTTTVYDSDIDRQLINLNRLLDKIKDKVDVCYRKDYAYESLHKDIKRMLFNVGKLPASALDSDSDSE